MKFWTKTYFAVLILFLLVFNGSILGILHTTYQYILSSEKEKALGEHHFIKNTIENDMDNLSVNNKLSQSAIENLMNYISDYYDKQDVSFLLMKNSNVAFSNLQYEEENLKEEFFNVDSGQNIILQGDTNSKFILVSGTIENSKDKYSFVYCYKLEGVIILWTKLENTFVYFSFFISLVLALLLGLMLNKRSKPLKQLINFVDEIKDGNYHSKVQLHGRDEFAMLGNNFNEMAEKIRETLEQLNNDMEMKQQFIDNLSHELRTPLTSIYGYADYIQKAAISEEDKYESTQYIMEESKRLQYMANRLLDMTIRKQKSIVKEKIIVEELLDKVKRTITPIADEKLISINISNTLSEIFGERELIESVMVNLLDNAVKASEEKGSIEILTIHFNGEDIIQIIDKGKGIAEEHLRHITEPFFRTDKARSKAEGGVGLGLTLCKQVMDMHDGKLKISSQLDKGTTVSLIFTTL